MLFGTAVELNWELPASVGNALVRSASVPEVVSNDITERVLASFNIYRDGNILAEDITQTFFTDETVSNNTAYSYQIVAVYENPDGVSEPSEAAELHTMFAPRDLTYSFDGSDVILNWLAPSGSGMTGYKVYRDGQLQTQTPITGLNWTDNTTTPETEYTYGISAVYEAGESVMVQIILITSGLEFNPPRMLAAEIGDGFVHLSWHLPEVDPTISGLELNHFKIFRNEAMIGNHITQTQYIDNEAANQTEYSYHATAVYTYMGANVESLPSNVVELTTRFPIRNLKATSIRFDVKLDWEVPASPVFARNEAIQSNKSVKKDLIDNYPLSIINYQFEMVYNVYRNNTLLTPTPLSALTFTDDNTTPAAAYTYRVHAVYDGIESPAVETTIIIPLFNPPTNLDAVVDDKGNVALVWEEPTNSLEFEVLQGYRVFRDETDLTENAIIVDTFFTEKNVPNGIYIYKVIAVYELGDSEAIEKEVDVNVSDDDRIELPLVTGLHGNYPNPFNPSTMIAFDVSVESIVSIDIFNIRGQKVKTLVNEMYSAGSHTIEWNGTDDYGRSVSSGVYFYSMRAGEYTEMRRMVLLK